MSVWTWVASVTIFFLLVHIRKMGQNHKAWLNAELGPLGEEIHRLKIAAGEIPPEPFDISRSIHPYDSDCVCDVCLFVGETHRDTPPYAE